MTRVPSRAAARKAEECPRSEPARPIPAPPASGAQAVAGGRPDELRGVAPLRREELGRASLPELLLHGLTGGACDDPANPASTPAWPEAFRKGAGRTGR